ncbi:MAG: rRNA maturation RNase YbeY [Patescibacteria group bacterium]
MLEFEIFNRTRRSVSQKIFFVPLKNAEKILSQNKKIKSQRKYRFELTFVGDAQMTRLNEEYHHKKRPTDVISLSYFEPKMKDSFIGEIFICLPYALRQAKQIGQTLQAELKFLFIHGLLHLFGYDHKRPQEEKQMLSLTYRILQRD